MYQCFRGDSILPQRSVSECHLSSYSYEAINQLNLTRTAYLEDQAILTGETVLLNQP